MSTTDIWCPCSDGTAFLPLQTLLSPVVCTVWIAAWWWAALEKNDRISEKKNKQHKSWAQCGTEPTYLLKKAHVQNTHTNLSNVFHCRKRSKNMLSWYWAKGSPLRCLWRSLIHEAGKSFITPFKHMYTHKMQGEQVRTYSWHSRKTPSQGSCSRLCMQLCSCFSTVDTHSLD